jgi:hypothetical protein
LERVVEVWPAVVDHVRSSGAEMLSSLFDGSRPVGIVQEKRVVRVAFPESAKFNKRKAEARPNVEKVAEALEAILGQRLRPVYELAEVDEEGPSEADDTAGMEEEEIIELIKNKFDAKEVDEESGPDARESEAG